MIESRLHIKAQLIQATQKLYNFGQNFLIIIKNKFFNRDFKWVHLIVIILLSNNLKMKIKFIIFTKLTLYSFLY